MSDREPKFLIGDIIDAAEKIKKYTSNLSFENFISDSKTVDAVIRNFEIIGEAARRLQMNLKYQHHKLIGQELLVSEIELSMIISVLIIK